MREETGRSTVAGLAVLLVSSSLLCATVPAAAAADGTIRITDAAFDDGNVVERRGEVRYLWASGAKDLSVTVVTGNSRGEGHYEVCVRSNPASEDPARELTCRSQVLTGNTTEAIGFSFERWPAGLAGRQSVNVVVIADTLSRDVVARTAIPVHVLREEGDVDGDGLSNRREVDIETNLSRADTDGDGLRDDFELDTYDTNPRTPDTDGDGLEDGPEVDGYGTDPNEDDTDGDGLADPLEIDVHGTNPNRADTDGDGLDDAAEINTHVTDPTSADTDGDGLDDEREVGAHQTNPSAADTDGDGLKDSLEVHTYETNPNKVDSDGDGLQDGPEAFEHETDPNAADTDGDGLEDGPEVNTYGTDPNKADTDGDGLTDGAEANRFETNPNAADTDGDGQDDGEEIAAAAPLRGRTGWVLALLACLALAGTGAWVVRSGRPVQVPGSVEELAAVPTDLARDLRERGPGRVPGTAAADPESSPPLTNEDRVVDLLRGHGGRMQQSRIVEETDWSKSKVSRLLSRMAEDGQVRKINVGRENVIALPGEEPERAKPPFDGDRRPERVSSEP